MIAPNIAGSLTMTSTSGHDSISVGNTSFPQGYIKGPVTIKDVGTQGMLVTIDTTSISQNVTGKFGIGGVAFVLRDSTVAGNVSLNSPTASGNTSFLDVFSSSIAGSFIAIGGPGEENPELNNARIAKNVMINLADSSSPDSASIISSTIGGNTTIKAGSGIYQVTLTSSVFFRNLAVSTPASLTLTIDFVTVHGTTVITDGNGVAKVLIDRSQFLKAFTVATGSGPDDVEIARTADGLVSFLGNVKIDLGNDTDFDSILLGKTSAIPEGFRFGYLPRTPGRHCYRGPGRRHLCFHADVDRPNMRGSLRFVCMIFTVLAACR